MAVVLTVPAKRFAYLAIVVAFGCVLSMRFVDLPLASFISGNTHPWVWLFFRKISYLGDGAIWSLLAAVILTVALVRRRFGANKAAVDLQWAKAAALQLIISLAASGLLVRLLKHSFGRLRPKNFLLTGVDSFAPLDFQARIADSFPSGHSQTIWAAMISLWFIYPRLRPFYLILAVAVSISRLILLKHYLSDVLFGGAIGVAAAVYTWRFLRTKAVLRSAPDGACTPLSSP